MTDTYDKIQAEIKILLLDNPDENPWIDLVNVLRENFIKLLIKLNIMYYEEQ